MKLCEFGTSSTVNKVNILPYSAFMQIITYD